MWSGFNGPDQRSDEKVVRSNGRGAPVKSGDDTGSGRFLFAGWLDNLTPAALKKLWRERHQSS